MSLPTVACNRCGRQIAWVTTDRGNRMPIDPDPTPGGIVYVRMVNNRPVATVVVKGDARPPGVAFTAHFATCPAMSMRTVVDTGRTVGPARHHPAVTKEAPAAPPPPGLFDPETPLEAPETAATAIPAHPARHDDPDTSQASADRYTTADIARFKKTSVKAELLKVFLQGDFTAWRAAGHLVTKVKGIPRDAPAWHARVETARKRISELHRAGYITPNGEHDHNPGSPDDSMVYTITSNGLDALRKLENTGWSR